MARLAVVKVGLAASTPPLHALRPPKLLLYSRVMMIETAVGDYLDGDKNFIARFISLACL